MKEQTSNRVKLGVFVLAATVCLILGLYYIGSQQNIFHKTISVISDFEDVGGLMPGNNVRFNGINVGTVSEVYPVSDTTIRVEFTIDEGSTMFITRDAVASIGTDGLLGNKLVNISPGSSQERAVQEGDVLQSLSPVEMESAMRTLSLTNDNLKVISDNLRSITEKFDNSNSLWNLLTDSVIAENVKSAVVGFQLTSEHTAVMTGDLGKIVADIRAGKGSIGALLTDTTMYGKLNQTIVTIKAVSDTVALITGDFRHFSEKLNSPDGAVGTLLTDTTFVHNLNQSMENIKDGTGNFNQNMEALKHSWPFKRYFKKAGK